MERVINTKFYHFNQNNSGGYFVENDEHGICSDVIIEAIDHIDAWNKLQKIGCNVSGMFNYCPCCGERWSEPWDDDEGKDEPMIYGEKIDDVEQNYFKKKCFIHYFDGTFKKIHFKAKGAQNEKTN